MILMLGIDGDDHFSIVPSLVYIYIMDWAGFDNLFDLRT
jgi:hypothetical protein